jgi:hypothetical protein
MTKNHDLSEYITKVKSFKSPAKVKIKTTNKDGDVEETVASRTYVSEHVDTEIDVAGNIDGLRDRLEQINKRSNEKVAEKASKPKEIDDVEDEVDNEALQEDAEVSFRDANDPQDDSPFTHVPNSKEADPDQTTAQMSETALLIELVAKLIEKIDDMQNFNPVIHVPAPVIHVTLPETRKTVTKAIERDENNFIKTVRESIEEAPAGDPLIEVAEETKPKRTKKIN